MSIDAPQIDISVADASQQAVIANLFQLYTHDFSEFWFDRPIGELEPDGRFGPYPLDPWWSEPDHVPLLVRVSGHLAGFALLNATSHSGRPVDRNMAEFFIVRKHRRGGLGSVVARTLFSRYPGVWEAAVVRRNVAALSFWRRAISGHAWAEAIEETDVDGPDWNGPILRFRALPPA
jgi:predicted acetyltransferase